MGKNGYLSVVSEIAFVDGNLPDLSNLLRHLRPEVKVYFVGGSDSIQNITNILSIHHKLQAIHLFAHGSPGRIHLGESVIDLQTLIDNRQQLASWQDAIGDSGEILIYSCHLAQGAQGKAFVGCLAEAVGKPVAASTTATGYAELGGDWLLQSRSSQMQAPIALTKEGQATWQGVLEDKLGDEEQVNTYEIGTQSEPAITALVGGGWVAVWRSENQDGQSAGLFAQIYDANGVAVGSEFQVNTTTPYGQYDASVTALTGGGFVVTWTDNVADGSSEGIFAQQFDASGAAVGREFQVNSYTTSSQASSDVIGSRLGTMLSMPIRTLPMSSIISTVITDSEIT